MKKNEDKKLSLKVRSGEMLDKFEALCFFFSESYQGMFEKSIIEYYNQAEKEFPSLKKALEVVRDKEEEISTGRKGK